MARTTSKPGVDGVGEQVEEGICVGAGVREEGVIGVDAGAGDGLGDGVGDGKGVGVWLVVVVGGGVSEELSVDDVIDVGERAGLGVGDGAGDGRGEGGGVDFTTKSRM